MDGPLSTYLRSVPPARARKAAAGAVHRARTPHGTHDDDELNSYFMPNGAGVAPGG